MPCWFWDIPGKVLKICNTKKVMFNRILFSKHSVMIWKIIICALYIY